MNHLYVDSYNEKQIWKYTLYVPSIAPIIEKPSAMKNSVFRSKSTASPTRTTFPALPRFTGFRIFGEAGINTPAEELGGLHHV
ncbi:MAG: hypothetical protein MI717_03965 [Spirochaetales bacterium]|nr:hypothetical protein [Spirochaetales bacterium]